MNETSRTSGRFIHRDGERLYEIRGIDAMEPFLMTVNGDSDLWMFVSSRGVFTAGRVQPDWCVFPYETDDTLHTLGGITGPVTLIRFADGRLWQPFSPRPRVGEVSQTLRRTPIGDRIEFEETDHATGLTFRAEFGLSSELGIVRICTLAAPDDAEAVEVELLDGYLRVMPAGVPLQLQQSMSTLVEGYARSELVDDAGLAVFTLESRISDIAAAMEMHYANAVWRVGLEDAQTSVSDDELRAFERGEPFTGSEPALGRRGSYLCRTRLTIAPGAREQWSIVMDARKDHAAIASLSRRLRAGELSLDEIEKTLAKDTARLQILIDQADAAQVTADEAACSAHRCNVMFNAMRGGIPLDGFNVDPEAFGRFVRTRHIGIADRHDALLARLAGQQTTVRSLATALGSSGDPQLLRLAMEYLPLTFARRHGDPSRPWNRFRIKIRDEKGGRIAAYEGNWRDIFQNWEAMSRAYPDLLPGMIAKFVNASTADGYNPYRINEHGIDWEKPELGNEWANIGYWGDHQIIYLLQLMKQCRLMHPDWLAQHADVRAFSYANVPYKLKPFREISGDPRRSILFDNDLDARIDARVGSVGDDARLVLDDDNEPMLVTLTEKLLVPALAKVSNLVPGGGVWMNTQRPEWNDANNALAGFGLSMVTLYQLRSYCAFVAELLEGIGDGETGLTAPVATWMTETNAIIEKWLDDASAIQRDTARWEMLSSLGLAAERARNDIYAGRTGPEETVKRADIAAFFRRAQSLCDESIREARRDDGLYHAYNVLSLTDAPETTAAKVEHLSEMLEGQVAVLASGVLSPGEAVDVLDALSKSSLFRPDQRAYMLYPRAELPPYLERNVIPEDAIAQCPLLQLAIESPEVGLVSRDIDGRARFHADIESHDVLGQRLSTLKQDAAWSSVVDAGSEMVHDAFERTFRHAEFTGRSGRMHKYEGLGSVFWHMYAKLVLAVQDCVFHASDHGADEATLDRLRAHYAAVRDGLGFKKTPSEFGAVPHEPYSHTPWNRCAQQPGMSGQVKEGILGRYGELGLRIREGRITFDPILIDPAELLRSSQRLVVSGESAVEVQVPPGAVGFTVCGTPVVVRISNQSRIRVHVGAELMDIDGNTLPADVSQAIFQRTGSVTLIEADVPPAWPDQAEAAGI